MSAFREIRRSARRDAHAELNVPALYIVGNETPLECSVRVRRVTRPLGDLVGGELTNSAYAEHEEVQPQIVFDANEISNPQRGATVSIEEGEAYRILWVKPRDGEFIVVPVALLDEADANGLPVPA